MQDRRGSKSNRNSSASYIYSTLFTCHKTIVPSRKQTLSSREGEDYTVPLSQRLTLPRFIACRSSLAGYCVVRKVLDDMLRPRDARGWFDIFWVLRTWGNRAAEVLPAVCLFWEWVCFGLLALIRSILRCCAF